MKNRYGMDGLTYFVNANTNNGHFEVKNYIVQDEDEETFAPNTKSNSYDDTDDYVKKRLASKYDSSFFNLKS
jgi:hypothetical protein